MVRVLGHEAVIAARRDRHASQEAGIDEQKRLRDLGLILLVTKWLLDTLINLVDVACRQRVLANDSRFGDVLCDLHDALIRMSEVLV